MRFFDYFTKIDLFFEKKSTLIHIKNKEIYLEKLQKMHSYPQKISCFMPFKANFYCF